VVTEKVESVDEEPASLRRLKALKQVDETTFRLWSFHEERAERLGDRMWTVGTWLIAVVAATLANPLPRSSSFPRTHFPT